MSDPDNNTPNLPRIPDELSQAWEVPRNSCLRQLSPTLQNNLCFRGCLRNANIDAREKNPVILPKDDHISMLLVRAARLWLLGGKYLTNSVLHNSVTCRKPRSKMQEHMTDLPPERLQTSPPFT